MTTRKRIDPDEMARFADFLEGRMPAEEADRFAAELAADPARGGAFEEYAEMDRLNRLLGEVEPAHAGFHRGRVLAWAGLAAAASVLMYALGRVLDAPAPAGELAAEVAALPSEVDEEDYVASLGLAPRPGVFRGPPGQVVEPGAEPEDGDYVRTVLEAERARAAEAIEQPATGLDALYFRVAFRPSVECSALVCTVDARGELEVPFAARLRRFAPGALHVLPEGLMLAGDYVEFESGFQKAGKEGATALVALRARAPSAELVAELESWQPSEADSSAAAELAAWLEARGFLVRSFELREP